MVNKQISLNRIFRALADPTRRAIVARLAKGPAPIGELGKPFQMTKAAITKHMKVLEGAGLIKRRIEGRVHRCEIDPRALDRAQHWVDQVRAYWEARLDDLGDYLEELKKQENGKTK